MPDEASPLEVDGLSIGLEGQVGSLVEDVPFRVGAGRTLAVVVESG